MDKWARFIFEGNIKFGKLDDDSHIIIYEGDLFDSPEATEKKVSVSDIDLQSPCRPSKMIALWNNYKALADEKGLSYPDKPLYIFKSQPHLLVQTIILSTQKIMMAKFFSLKGALVLLLENRSKILIVQWRLNQLFLDIPVLMM